MVMHRIEAVAVNIAIHPHSPSLYRQLFQEAFRLRKRVQIHGDRVARITQINYEDRQGKSITLEAAAPESVIVTGVVGTFVPVDMDDAWLNEKTDKPATPEELDQFKFPPHLMPKLRSFNFYFDPACHIVVVETLNGDSGSMTPSLVERFFKRLFAAAELTEKFGQAEVTLLPEADTVEQILSSPNLRLLWIRITRPNPDDAISSDEQARRLLEEEHAKTMELIYSAQQRQNLKPSDMTKELARVAARNGFVKAQNAGERVRVSTRDHPMVANESFDDQLTTHDTTFRNLAATFVARSKPTAKETPVAREQGEVAAPRDFEPPDAIPH